jgi:hypothetical protein
MDKDIRWAIKEVMSKSKSDLAGAGMWDFDKESFKPVASYKITFDSQQNQLEPIYYWFLDFMGGWKPKKIVDNFTASPGSGQFSEMNMKATKMQEEGMKILGGLNQVIKSVLNLVYDLKEFELRLEHYDDYASEDEKKKEVGDLALKNIWLDNVDMKRGRGSIHQMTAELGYSTLREAFMMARNVDDLDRMNKEDKETGGGGVINDQVMRILKPRLEEFIKWVKYSEKELRKRFSIEKNYLKSQVETIKLYNSWMRPYLVAAEKLRQEGFEKDAALVNAFSTTMFELQLFGKKDVGVGDVYGGKYKSKRDYHKVVVVGMVFRGHVSQRVTQKGDYGFAMGGKIDMTFDSYALNSEELKAAEELFHKESVNDSLGMSIDVAGDALNDLKEDLDHFLDGKKDDPEKKKEERALDINPFAALFGLGKKKSKNKDSGEDKVLTAEEISKDNWIEAMMREEAANGAAGGLYTIYDIYKKAHRMASAPDNFDADV